MASLYWLNSFAKRSLGVFALLAVVVSMSACQKKGNDSQRVAVGSRTDQNVRASSGIQFKASIKADSQYQDNFQDAVRALLSATMPENYVGYVSATGQYNTGVYFGGRVRLVSGSIMNPYQGSVQIAPNSELLVGIYDYWQGQNNVEPIPPIYMTRATGTVQGQSVSITFQDNYGWIRFTGQISQNNFVGTVDFENSVNYTKGVAGQSGTLGYFSIPTCDFFVCN